MRSRRRTEIVALLALTAACSTVDGPSGSYDQHLKAWREIEPTSYEFEYAQQCFCVQSGIWWRIQVSNGAFVSATPIVDPVPTGVTARHLTIDSVFAQVRAALDDKHATVAITYDPVWHNPSVLSVDPLKNAVDDEWALLARAVKATP